MSILVQFILTFIGNNVSTKYSTKMAREVIRGINWRKFVSESDTIRP